MVESLGIHQAPDQNESAAGAARELAELNSSIDAARLELARLQHDVEDAESQWGSNHAAQLLEANEHLVLASMRAQAEAESANDALNEVSRSAELDGLTTLPNRVLLLDRFAHAIAIARRRKSKLALLFVDLDNFKQINDTLGHSVGDDVLKLVADCLTASVREADTVSRHGGDEFLILLTEVAQPADAARVADKVIAALDACTAAGGHAINISASIGISVYPDDGEDANTLIDRADAAMYRAKRHGKGGFAFHGKEPAGKRSLATMMLSSIEQSMDQRVQTLAEHKLRHAQLREANQQLLMAALSAQQLQAAAEQAQRQQTDFLAVLAHELRNPLAPIRTAASLLGQVRNDAALLAQVQGVIERQVVHMTRLVGDLLDVSRVHTGKLRVALQQVDIAGIVDAAADACRPSMQARGQRFDVRLPAGALPAQGDPVRLAQILSNLLDNASKYTPDGGEIELAVGVVGDSVVMTVSDNGIGISAAALPRIFDPFVQDPHAIGFNGAGLGIGLTVVRELVEAHGGSVVASSAGTALGSEFVVTLPLVGASPGARIG